jgi:DNA polymerase I
VTPSELPFEEIWLHDFEFVAQPGEHPDVVCLVARELRSGQTLRLWRDELGARPPYRTDRGVLFINFVANAECACHLALGWPLPARVLDLSPAFRNLTNGRSTLEGKGLLGALRYYGFSNIDQKQKDAMRERIMRGWPFTSEERQKILTYCAGDVNDLLRLLTRMLPEIDLGVALYHGEFAAASALMEHRGVPIDMAVFPQLADRATWSAVRDALVPAIDAQYGVYVRDASGEWSFNMKLFMAYLDREGITGWPLLESGKLNLRRKTIEDMAALFRRWRTTLRNDPDVLPPELPA